MNYYNKFITIFIAILVSACSSYEAQYTDGTTRYSGRVYDIIEPAFIDDNDIE